MSRVGQAGPDRGQQFDELSPLGLGQRGQRGSLQRDDFRQELVDDGPPVLRDHDEQPSSVGGVGLAFDQPTAFQGVEQRSDARRRHDEPFGDGGRGQGLPGPLQDRERPRPALDSRWWERVVDACEKSLPVCGPVRFCRRSPTRCPPGTRARTRSRLDPRRAPGAGALLARVRPVLSTSPWMPRPTC